MRRWTSWASGWPTANRVDRPSRRLDRPLGSWCWIGAASAEPENHVAGRVDLRSAGGRRPGRPLHQLRVLDRRNPVELVAVPRRLRLLAAKATVLLAWSWWSALISSHVVFLIGQALLARADLETSLGGPGVLRAVLGGGLCIAASALCGLAFGTLLRRTAGGIVAAIAALLNVLRSLICCPATGEPRTRSGPPPTRDSRSSPSVPSRMPRGRGRRATSSPACGTELPLVASHP